MSAGRLNFVTVVVLRWKLHRHQPGRLACCLIISASRLRQRLLSLLIPENYGDATMRRGMIGDQSGNEMGGEKERNYLKNNDTFIL